MADKIVIFDTTLRDGEQSPGASMTREEKLHIARQLERLKVDVIEAGFAASSNGDFEAVKAIAAVIKDSTVCSLARANDRDISRAAEALKGAAASRVHTFIATSALHMEKKLRMTPEQVYEQARLSVRFARNLMADVEFSPEDGYRSDPDFLCRVLEAVIDEGATTINIPDTVGYATPTHMGNVIRNLKNRVPNIDKATISIHCHNDLGLAVANSRAAVEAGAGQIGCTMNGIGERAGNCSLEEVVMALRTRFDYYQCTTHINTKRLVPTSRLLQNITGMQVQRNKAIVGRNAFAHEAGIHQDGMLKERSTYEIMRPEDVGLTKTDLVLGKHSGRAALGDRAKALGYQLTGEQLQAVFEKFKRLCDKKKEVYDADIAALIELELHGLPEVEVWTMAGYKLTAAAGQTPSVSLTLCRGKETVTKEVTVGDGPFDALFLAIEQITGIEVTCRDFSVHSVTVGKDAQGEVTVEVEHGGQVYRGRGVSTDSVEASALAFLNAINRVAATAGRPKDRVSPHEANVAAATTPTTETTKT